MPNYGFKDRGVAEYLRDFAGKHRLIPTPPGFVPPENFSGPANRVYRVTQSSGATCPVGGLLRIISTAADSTNPHIFIVTCGKPNTTFQLEYLVNLWAPLESGKHGYASELIHSDWCLRGEANSTARRWGAKNGEWGLYPHRPGYQMLHNGVKTLGSDNYIYLKQHTVPFVIGKADTAINSMASGTVRVYTGGTQGSETDTGQTISSCYNPGPNIADEAWVSVSWPNGLPYVFGMSCPA